MNNPEYILTDEMGIIVAAVQAALQQANLDAGQPAGWPVLNYQYGYIEELNETLQQYEADPAKFDKKFPLFWLAEPYDTQRGVPGIFGTVNPRCYIINTTDKTWKATTRMENNYKPVLFPVYREWLRQLVISPVFSHQSVETISHRITKGYYWGEAQRSVLNDAVDCLMISSLTIRINNNINCTPFKNF